MPSTVLDLERLVKHKKAGFYPAIIKVRTDIPANSKIRLIFHVPTDMVYIMVREIHDVADGVFIRKSEKDGDKVLPESLVTGDIMTIDYAEPLIVNNIWEDTVENTDTTNAREFRLTFYLLMCPARKFERELF